MNKINIERDLKNIKKEQFKLKVMGIIKKWREELHTEKKEFKEQFLSEENDKHFNALKDLIGEFKAIEKDINVLGFLYYIIVGGGRYSYFKGNARRFFKIKKDTKTLK